MAAVKQIHTSALGRTVEVGCLYSAFTDSFSAQRPSSATQANTQLEAYEAYTCTLATSVAAAQKSDPTNASSELHLSLGARLTGASGFSRGKQGGKHVESVSLVMSSTHYVGSLSTCDISASATDDATMTHVVTHVTYGDAVTLTFEKDGKPMEQSEGVKDTLHALVEAIPAHALAGGEFSPADDRQRAFVKDIRVTYHGDLELGTLTPTTFADAVRAYTNLKELLVASEAGVPVSAVLQPLSRFCAVADGPLVPERPAAVDRAFQGLVQAHPSTPGLPLDHALALPTRRSARQVTGALTDSGASGLQVPCPPPSPPALEQPLPPNWAAAIDAQSGRQYFYHALTRQTTWERPQSPLPPTIATKQGVMDESGIALYQYGSQVYDAQPPPSLLDPCVTDATDSAVRLTFRLAEEPTHRLASSSPIEDVPSCVSGYVCFWRRRGDQRWQEVEQNDPGQLQVTVEGLARRSEYEFQLQAKSPHMAGPLTHTITARTLDKEKTTLNILVLGETGVGKSTFINAFCNYVTYANLQDAEEGGLMDVMQSSFEFNNQTIKVVGDDSVQLGSADAEGTQEDLQGAVAGASCTQYPKTYTFELPGFREGQTCVVNFIDTPGIGDTRGEKQDLENMENVIQHLNRIDRLDAIIMLLKPNQSRLNVVFRYCMECLLQQLNRDALQNILFVMTSARSTMYAPGDTLPNLRTHLSNLKLSAHLSTETDQNLFMVDSESFRYLAVRQQLPEHQFEPRTRSMFSDSFDISVAACRRLLMEIKQRPSLDVAGVRELNKTRKLIENLRHPLHEVQALIGENKKIADERAKDMQAAIRDARAISPADLKTTYWAKAVQDTDRPRTVCTHSDCTTYKPSAASTTGKEQIAVYTVCHDGCRLRDVPPDVVGDWRLAGCKAMSADGICNQSDSKPRGCSHSWQAHKHVLYVYKDVEHTVDNPAMIQRLHAARTSQGKARVLKEEHLRIAARFQEEEETILDALAKFACFLDDNAIVAFPDSLDEYMAQQIKEKRQLLARLLPEDTSGKEKLDQELEDLDKRRKKYKCLKSALMHDICEGNKQRAETGGGQGARGRMTTDDVTDLFNKLLQLEFCGPQLKQAMDCNARSEVEQQDYLYRAATAFRPPTLGGSALWPVQKPSHLQRAWGTVRGLVPRRAGYGPQRSVGGGGVRGNHGGHSVRGDGYGPVSGYQAQVAYGAHGHGARTGHEHVSAPWPHWGHGAYAAQAGHVAHGPYAAASNSSNQGASCRWPWG